MQQTKTPLEGKAYAWDFDGTLTKKSTFTAQQLSAVVPTTEITYTQVPFCCGLFPITKEVPSATRHDDFQNTLPDKEITSNLRNPKLTAAIMKHIADNGGQNYIISNHDNKAWIRRNLKLLLNNDPLAEKIVIIALQSREDMDLGGKVGAMKHLQKKDRSINEFTLIDDSQRQNEHIKLHNAKKEQGEGLKINFIHAEVGHDDYISTLALRVQFNPSQISTSTYEEIEPDETAPLLGGSNT